MDFRSILLVLQVFTKKALHKERLEKFRVVRLHGEKYLLFDASFFHLFFHEFLFLFLYRISLLFCFEGIEIFFYFVGTHDEHHLPNQGPIPLPRLFSRF